MIITKNSDKNAFYDSYAFLYGHVQASLAVRDTQPRPEQVLTPTASAPWLGNKKEQVLSCCAA